MSYIQVLVAVAAAAYAAGSGAGRQLAAGAAFTLQPIPSPAGPDTSSPQMTQSDRGVLLSWLERSGTRTVLRYAERTATGWSPVRTVGSGADWFVNWADVPSVLRMDARTLAAHWLQKSGTDRYAYDVRLSHSRDDGRAWSASVVPHADRSPTEHGFVSLLRLPSGGLGLAWLDGRGLKPQGAHGAGHAGAMSIRYTTYDANWRQAPEQVVDDRVCECCPTAATVTADGPVIAFRNRTDAEVRDIHVARLAEGRWTSSHPVHDDGWKIAACPVNGPALTAAGRRVAAAWFTAAGDHGRAFIAFSDDAGRTFGEPIRLDDGVAVGRVSVGLLPGGAAVAGYIEHSDGRSQFRIRRIAPTGTRSTPMTVATLEEGRASGYPRLAFHAGEIVLAWTARSADTTRVLTAVAPMPR